MKQFDTRECCHRLPLTLLGRQVQVATDSHAIFKSLGNAFGSRFFMPQQQAEPESTFFCKTNCLPWDMVMGLDGDTYVSRKDPDRPFTYELLRWQPEGTKHLNFYSFENSTDLSTTPAESEMFAAYFQRRLLSNLLQKQPGLHMIHGGALSHAGSGLLLLAPSRCGKSTLSLACVLSGMGFLSDDHIPFDFRTGVMEPFPRMLRLREGTCQMLPEFRALCTDREVDPTGETRYFLYPEKIRADALGSSVKLTHVVCLKGFGKKPSLSPIRSSEVALHCAEADFFASPQRRLELLWQWGNIIDKFSCHQLVVGHPLETAELLKNLIQSR